MRMGSPQTKKRFAIYYAPETGSGLDQFGRQWFCAHGMGNQMLDRLTACGISEEQLKSHIAPAAHYGFHGTFKPPFQLPSTHLEPQLIEDIERFARDEKSFFLPGLQLSCISRFIALVPCRSSQRLNRLAERCVRFFDAYRKPESEACMDKRRKALLNLRQEHYLVTWGYPYVMKEFRFHLTLTGSVANEQTKQTLYNELERQLAPVRLSTVPVNSICLFVQKNRQAPFVFHSRYRFKND